MRVKINDGISLHKFQKKSSQYIQLKPLVKYDTEKKPYFTVVMLSWNRWENLILVLQDLLKHKIPMNLCLTIQECNIIPAEKKKEIEKLIVQFHAADVEWHSINRGTGAPRGEAIDRALKQFDSPYILTTDDDMFFPKYSFQALASMLEDKPEYGVVSLWCDPSYSKIVLEEKPKPRLKVLGFNQGFHDVTCLGSATAMWRREIFDKCKYDQNYVIGWADFDLTLQIHYAGWKLGVLCLNYLKPLNDKGKNTPSYNKVRHNIIPANQGKKYFKNKWGFTWGR
jgi:GT2 family glycosyltransferase